MDCPRCSAEISSVYAEPITVNDRIVRMAQEQAGRTLRSANWRHELTSAVLATWPADPLNRTKKEWEAVRGAMTGGGHLPSSVFTASTRQILRFAGAGGAFANRPV